MKIVQRGFFKDKWICACGNRSTTAGFIPVNVRGDYEEHLFRRSELYACCRCGRMIQRHTGKIVGLTPGFKVSRHELRGLLILWQAEHQTLVGLNKAILLNFLSQRERLQFMQDAVRAPTASGFWSGARR